MLMLSLRWGSSRAARSANTPGIALDRRRIDTSHDNPTLATIKRRRQIQLANRNFFETKSKRSQRHCRGKQSRQPVRSRGVERTGRHTTPGRDCNLDGVHQVQKNSSDNQPRGREAKERSSEHAQVNSDPLALKGADRFRCLDPENPPIGRSTE